MESTHSLQGYKIALLIDFDNVILGVDDPGFDVELVVNALRSRGQVVMGRAYGDWYRHNRHRRKLMEHGIELVETPVFGPVIKNSADIRIVLDGFEIAMLQHHIDAFCLVSGDSDFLPLIKKLQYLGKHVIVVSGNKFTSDLVRRNCNEFISYENLLAESLGATEDVSTLEGSFALLTRSITTLHERGMEVRSSTVKQMMLQLNPAFSERNFSCPQFKQFLDKAVRAGIVKLGGRDSQSGEFVVFLPGDFDEIEAPEISSVAVNGKTSAVVPSASDDKRTGRERRRRTPFKADEAKETVAENGETSEEKPLSPVELGASAANEIAPPSPNQDFSKGNEVRVFSPENLLNRGMRRGRLRFSGKERRAQLAKDEAPTENTEEIVPELVAEASTLAPELVGVEHEAPSEEIAVVAADETDEIATPEATIEENAAKSEGVASADVPELVAEAIELAPELVDMTVDVEPSVAADEQSENPKKRPTRRGGRGRGKKTTAEKSAAQTETIAETAAQENPAEESVSEATAPAEVTEAAVAGDAISTPEAAIENAAAPSESDEAPKTRRRVVRPAPRRRPAAKKKKAE